MGDSSPDLPAGMRNIKLVVAYDGTRYHGWQRQAGGVPTVQGCLEGVIGGLGGREVAVNGASRTDAGVHAAGQVANFLTGDTSIPLSNLRRAIDGKCPPDVAVLSVEQVSADFHASRWAVEKTYRYRIHVAPAKPVMLASQVYHFPRGLDLARMAAAAERLAGRHDFRGFASADERRENTVRTIGRCEVSAAADELHVTVRGDGFLYKMVRNVVGTLIEIGRGRWAAERIDRILQTRDRTLAGPTAPPGGLCLMCVRYPPRTRLAGACSLPQRS